MKKKIINTIVYSILTANIIFLVYFFNNKYGFVDIRNKMTNELKFEYIIDKRCIAEQYLMALDKNMDSISLNNIIKPGPKIVFRYSQSHCSSCVENYLNKIKKYYAQHNLSYNLIVLANYTEFRSFNVMQRIYEHGFKAYYMDRVINNIEFEKFYEPYIMVLDSTMNAEMILLLNLDNEEKLFAYLDTVNDKYFN